MVDIVELIDGSSSSSSSSDDYVSSSLSRFAAGWKKSSQSNSKATTIQDPNPDDNGTVDRMENSIFARSTNSDLKRFKHSHDVDANEEFKDSDGDGLIDSIHGGLSSSDSNSSSGISDSDSDSESDDESENHGGDDDSDSVASNSGAAIESKYGTENIKVADGVAFSAASSMFFSNIASGGTESASDASQSAKTPTARASVHHSIPEGDLKPKAKPNPAVNPYKRTSPSRPKYQAVSPAVNPYKTASHSTPGTNVHVAKKPSSLEGLSQVVQAGTDTRESLKSPMNPYKLSSPKPASTSNPTSTSKFTNPYATSKHASSSSQPSNYSPTESALAQDTNTRGSITQIGNQPNHTQSPKLTNEASSSTPPNTLIDPSLYKPPTYQPKPQPNLIQMTIQTIPKHTRRMTPVHDLFRQPISKFWTSKFHSFNHLQSELANTLVYSDDNVVVSAPTGAGKTCIFEMAMGRLFTGASASSASVKDIPKSRKIVYISPSKALCDERYNDWTKRLADMDPNIECAVVTGDASSASFQEVAGAHVILTTPEKWDSITRKWTDHLVLIGSVKLLMIDEVHLLGDESRGGCLEAIICRMKTVQRAAKAKHRLSDAIKDGLGTFGSRNTLEEDTLGMDMRIVCVSATLPNIIDIASFIDAHEAYSFDASFRPVPLTTHVVGLGYIGKNQFLFDKNLGKEVPGLVHRFANKKPSIIFCHAKKQTETLALELTSTCGISTNERELDDLSKQTNLVSLQKCLRRGIAYHHAGLEAENRNLIEKAFGKGLIRCLCATSTLAMGVNLPAHLVIIKGTRVWRGTGQGYQDIDSGTLLQMIGRAGRPGFDTCGTAVIMTDKKSKPSYERMSTGLEVVESKLLRNLLETLNTEISQKVINNVEEAIDWLKGTFFFIRVIKNPKHYGLFGKSESERESYLMNQCMQSLQNLYLSKVIELSDNGKHIQAKRSSLVMSRHLVPFDAMKSIIELPHDCGPLQILQMLSEMSGLHYPVRRAEKSHLNEAHKIVKYKLDGPPSKVRVQTPQQKTFVLLQAAIGQYYFDDYTLRQEMSFIVENASRMLSAAEDFSVEESKHGKIALECMLMRRCLATSLWSAKDGVLNQIMGVGQKTAAKLAMHNIRTFEDLAAKSSCEIEQASGRASPFGQQLRTAASKILQRRMSLSAHIEGLDDADEDSVLVCQLVRDNENKPGTRETDREAIVKYTLVVHTDRPGGALMCRSNIIEPGCHKIVCPSKFGRIYIHLVSNLVGLDGNMFLDGNDSVKKASLTFTPVKGPDSSKKKRKKVRKSSCKKEPLSSSIMQHMVDGIEDMRVPKRNKPTASASKSIRTPSSSKSSSFSRQTQKKDTMPSDMEDRTVVTPSPSLLESSARRRDNNPAPFASNISSQRQQRETRKPAPRENVSARHFNSKRTKSNQKSWQREKKDQKAFQQRAFGSPKENPFSAFKFDPNESEKQLEQQAEITHQTDSEDFYTSIFPSSSRSLFNDTPVIHAKRRSKFLSSQYPRQKSPQPPKYKPAPFVGSARRQKSAMAHGRLRNQDLLRQKAEEQQAYSKVIQDSRIHGIGYNRTNAFSPPGRNMCPIQSRCSPYDNANHHPNRPIQYHTASSMPAQGESWGADYLTNSHGSNFIPYQNQTMDTYSTAKQSFPFEQLSNPSNKYEFEDVDRIYDNMAFIQQNFQDDYHQSCDQVEERSPLGASLGNSNISGTLYDQQPIPFNIPYANPPHIHAYHNDYHHPGPIQEQSNFIGHSHIDKIKEWNLGENIDPQGMIITVEEENGRATENGGQADDDFEKAFF